MSPVVGINSPRFVTPESISSCHERKPCRTLIFHELFFRKYDNFQIIIAGNIYLSMCQELNFLSSFNHVVMH